MTIFGDKVFKEVSKVKWGHRVGPSSNMAGILMRDTSNAHRERATWGHSKKVADYKPRREASSRPCRYLDLGLQTPELWENKCPLFKPPNPWHFVIAARTKTSSHFSLIKTCQRYLLIKVMTPMKTSSLTECLPSVWQVIDTCQGFLLNCPHVTDEGMEPQKGQDTTLHCTL